MHSVISRPLTCCTAPQVETLTPPHRELPSATPYPRQKEKKISSDIYLSSQPTLNTPTNPPRPPRWPSALSAVISTTKQGVEVQTHFQHTSLEGPSLHPEFGEGRPGVVEGRVGHGGGTQRGEASCELETGSLTLELHQQPARGPEEGEEEEGPRRGGPEGCCWVEGGGGRGFTSFKEQKRRSSGRFTATPPRDKAPRCIISSSCTAPCFMLLDSAMDERSHHTATSWAPVEKPQTQRSVQKQ